MPTEFDEDTALTRDGDVWRGRVSRRWHVAAGANGGYIATYPLRAMLDLSPFPDPMTMTTHFLQRPTWDDITVRARLNHTTRAHAYLEAHVEQAHGLVATAMAVCGTRRDGEVEHLSITPPTLPPPLECPLLETPDDDSGDENMSMEFVRRFEYRVPDADRDAFWAPTPSPPVIRGWSRLRDRDLDNVAVPLFMDSYPPAVFGAKGVAMVPTVELTVHWRGRPTTTWHLAEFRTRHLTDGYIEEDGELWGEDGRLVAQSRQLARFTALPNG